MIMSISRYTSSSCMDEEDGGLVRNSGFMATCILHECTYQYTGNMLIPYGIPQPFIAIGFDNVKGQAWLKLNQ